MTRNARLMLFTAAFAALSLPCAASAQFKLADGLAGAQGSAFVDGVAYALVTVVGPALDIT
ncbi:MAG: hypothetical protein EHM68_15060 [Lysobacterales bacterium]|nr:MAG: hypothetical protein EHM68_15060 [Xanthomonadales bacterium]